VDGRGLPVVAERVPQVGVVREVPCRVESVGRPAFGGAVVDEVGAAGVAVDPERRDQVAVRRDVPQAVEGGRPSLGPPELGVVPRARVVVGAEGGYQVRPGGDVLQPVEQDGPALGPAGGEVVGRRRAGVAAERRLQVGVGGQVLVAGEADGPARQGNPGREGLVDLDRADVGQAAGRLRPRRAAPRWSAGGASARPAPARAGLSTASRRARVGIGPPLSASPPANSRLAGTFSRSPGPLPLTSLDPDQERVVCPFQR
jgi:hypothetical protein